MLQVGFPISERRACAVIGIGRSSQRYRSRASDQTALRMRLRDRAAARVRYGYRRLHVLLQREGWRVNQKRVIGSTARQACHCGARPGKSA